ncbi:hypothetical protein AB205_0042680 [Aquarana catesbeiana]|uniref:Uncharacterized protein n=1 Tax=Aquarana catesbeiana TaxID=8400 RepID=A0A2G9RE23_AQUCT|nr:hypothetical protein AB205_0042680 [Aquarana catesbeiana]
MCLKLECFEKTIQCNVRRGHSSCFHIWTLGALVYCGTPEKYF